MSTSLQEEIGSTDKMNTINRTVRQFGTRTQCSMIAFALLSVCPLRALQDAHTHTPAAENQELTAEQRSKASALLNQVRDSTARFKDVSVAVKEGYAPQFGCVAGPDAGAMGLHYVNGDLVKSGILDVTRPQIVIYEPAPDGSLRLIGADYLLLADPWDAKYPNPPELMGQLFHYWETPNRFRLPAFYTLHVWAWKDNPKGPFVNWHPHVSCETFSGDKP